MNSGLWVGSVPAEAGTCFCRANEPAMPSTKTIGANRPNSIANPSAVFHHVVFTVMPANAEPLLLPADVNA
jgi:hypothetical protein